MINSGRSAQGQALLSPYVADAKNVLVTVSIADVRAGGSRGPAGPGHQSLKSHQPPEPQHPARPVPSAAPSPHQAPHQALHQVRARTPADPRTPRRVLFPLSLRRPPYMTTSSLVPAAP